MSHTADGCEISTVSRSRYACSKCIARHLFRSRVLKEEKGFQSSYASCSIGSPRRPRVFTGLPCFAFVQDDSSSLPAQDANVYDHSAGCTQVCVSQSNDSHLSSDL